MEIVNRYNAARERFFAENPKALAEAEASASPALIEAAGMTVDEFMQHQRLVIFAQAAERQGLEVDEFVIRLIAESPEQAQSWRLERHQKMASALGIEWNEYKQLNRITE